MVVSPELIDYISGARAQGTPDNTIVKNLKQAGWDDLSIQTAMVSLITLEKPQSATSHKYSPAPKWNRLFAALTDYIVIGFVSAYFYRIAISISTAIYQIPAEVQVQDVVISSVLLIAINALLFLGQLIYWVVAATKYGTSLGKDLYGLKIVSYPEQQPIRLRQAVVRETLRIFYLVPFLGVFIDTVRILFSKEGQSLRDRAASTQVVKVGKVWPLWKQLLILGPILAPGIVMSGWSYFHKSPLKNSNSSYTTSLQQQNFHPSQVSPFPTPGQLIDISKWKTYVNTDYGYSVKYPSEWYMRVVSSGWVDFSSKPISESGILNDPFVIYVHKSQTMQQTIDMVRSQGRGVDADIQLAGTTAHELYNVFGAVYFLQKNNYVIEIDTARDQKDILDTLNTMLSTFSFTK